MQYVLSPGNVGNRETVEWLENLAAAKSQAHIVRGDFDENPNMPQTKVVTIGNIKIGIIHGHQVVPWGDIEALSAVQRQLDCDLLISGHTHQQSVTQYDGKYFINPGSVTGAYSPQNPDPKPSFILMAIQGDDIVAFMYTLVNDEVDIKSLEFSIKK